MHHCDPLSKAETKVWKMPQEKTPAHPRKQKSAGKVLLSVFWDSEGVLLKDCLSQRRTINGEYYANLNTRLREAIKEKRREKLSHGASLAEHLLPFAQSPTLFS